MRAFGHEDDRTRVTTRLQRGADAQDAAQFTMRACLGAHRNAVHAGQRHQPMCEFVDHAERTLDRGHRLQGMQVGKAGHARDLLVQARIVLHRARAEREDAAVDRVVLARKARVVSDRLRLGQAGQAQVGGTGLRSEPRCCIRIAGGKVDAASVLVAKFEEQFLFEHERPVAGDGRQLAQLGGLVDLDQFGCRRTPA